MSPPVLICDDSAIARKQLTRALPESWDVTVEYAGNGQEALTLLRQKQYAVLFLDLTMPVLDGLGVLAAIRNEQIEVFTIVVSADIQPEMRRRVTELGALAFIQKPAKPETLLPVLQDYGLIG
jgi:CheY-like chemotaxis protein